jgi:hypothetical protein
MLCWKRELSGGCNVISDRVSYGGRELRQALSITLSKVESRAKTRQWHR